MITYTLFYVLMRSANHISHLRHLNKVGILHTIHHSIVAISLLMGGYFLYSESLNYLQMIAVVMIIIGITILSTQDNNELK